MSHEKDKMGLFYQSHPVSVLERQTNLFMLNRTFDISKLSYIKIVILLMQKQLTHIMIMILQKKKRQK